MIVARVIVDIPTRGLSEPFDYLVPDHLADEVHVGAVVLAPFGSRPIVGYVVEIKGDSSVETLKPLDGVLMAQAFQAADVQIAVAVAHEYVCPLSVALRLFLPPGGTPRIEACLQAIGDAPTDSSQRGVWERCLEPCSEAALAHARNPQTKTLVEQMIRESLLIRTWRLVPPNVAPVDERWATLVESSEFAPRANATLQRVVLHALSEGPVRVAELVAEYGSGVSGALARLEKAGALRVEDRRRMRSVTSKSGDAPRPAELTSAQVQALRTIEAGSPGSVVLLDGVTGSGKTEVYLQAIERTLQDGRGAIVLVPEISLTPQTVGRFRSRFGDSVAVMHSRLSAGERYDEWDRVRSGAASVVVGARSALFAPVRDLGIIIIDEEHEGSYKQAQSPRYHARRVAELVAQTRGALLVLGSATPSMESLQSCQEGRYQHVVLPERVSNAVLPEVQVVDMSEEFESGHRSMFSRALLKELQAVEEAGHKAVLLLNRRGFATFILCRECGYVPECDNCSVSYTYHERSHRLICHHCGATADPPPVCPRCGSGYLRKFGAGTERVETELAGVTGMPIVRMDADTTSGKGGHERVLATFESLPTAILLGTQMVAKGLDYPEVTLVGVINADTTLHMPDFRAGERTFQMLSQVAGRAGRGSLPGRVIIQTYWPDNPAIVAAASHDRTIFYQEELSTRAALMYPPFGRLARVLVSGEKRADVSGTAAAMAAALVSIAPESVSVLGPGPAAIERLKGQFRWQILLKSAAEHDVADLLARALCATGSSAGVTVAVDVDPVDML